MDSLYEKKPARIFGESMFGAVMIIFLGVSIMARGYQGRQDFQSVTGAILNAPGSIIDESDSEANAKKMRYFLVDGYPKNFAIPIGKDFGDFTPRYEKVDSLKKGDIITVYFDDKKNSSPYFNRLVQFIDKDQKPYFVRGNHDIYWGWSAILTGLGITALLFLYKKRGKIT